MNNFLFDRTADFRFYIVACSVAFSPANECTNIYFEYRRSLFLRAASSAYLIARDLNSLSYAM